MGDADGSLNRGWFRAPSFRRRPEYMGEGDVAIKPTISDTMGPGLRRDYNLFVTSAQAGVHMHQRCDAICDVSGNRFPPSRE